MLAAVMLPTAALADGYFDKGKELFEKKKYREALPYLHQAVVNAPWDSTAAYYEALDYQYLKDWKSSCKAYEASLEHFPGTQAYNNAITALKTLDPNYLRNHPQNPIPETGAASSTATSTPASQGGGNDVAAMLQKVVVSSANEVKIPANRMTDKTWVDGAINGKNFKFDFGSDETTISPKDAEALKLPAKSGRVLVSIKVGGISETNFPLLIGETDKPKLGKDFFHQFTYSLEPSQIVATRKPRSGVASSWDVPFRKSGKDMMVDIQCNGRRCSVVFDPEGSECVVPARRAREFGLEVNETSTLNRYDPETNPNGPQRGEAGFGEVKTATVADAKILLGPASSEVRVKVDESAKEAKFNNSILGGWKIKVDPAANMLRFGH
jgi:hypothetical protein